MARARRLMTTPTKAREAAAGRTAWAAEEGPLQAGWGLGSHSKHARGGQPRLRLRHAAGPAAVGHACLAPWLPVRAGAAVHAPGVAQLEGRPVAGGLGQELARSGAHPA